MNCAIVLKTRSIWIKILSHSSKVVSITPNNEAEICYGWNIVRAWQFNLNIEESCTSLTTISLTETKFSLVVPHSSVNKWHGVPVPRYRYGWAISSTILVSDTPVKTCRTTAHLGPKSRQVNIIREIFCDREVRKHHWWVEGAHFQTLVAHIEWISAVKRRISFL